MNANFSAPAIPADLLPHVAARAERDGIALDAAYAAILEISRAAQRKARERVEEEDAYGPIGGRY